MLGPAYVISFFLWSLSKTTLLSRWPLRPFWRQQRDRPLYFTLRLSLSVGSWYWPVCFPRLAPRTSFVWAIHRLLSYGRFSQALQLYFSQPCSQAFATPPSNSCQSLLKSRQHVFSHLCHRRSSMGPVPLLILGSVGLTFDAMSQSFRRPIAQTFIPFSPQLVLLAWNAQISLMFWLQRP